MISIDKKKQPMVIVFFKKGLMLANIDLVIQSDDTQMYCWRVIYTIAFMLLLLKVHLKVSLLKRLSVAV